MIRFLGASPASSTMHQTLRLMCYQLILCLDFRRMHEPATMKSNENTVDFFYSLLKQFASSYELSSSSASASCARIVIYLDGLDLLEGRDTDCLAAQLSWLRTPLPAGTRLIISTCSEAATASSMCFGLVDALSARIRLSPSKLASPQNALSMLTHGRISSNLLQNKQSMFTSNLLAPYSEVGHSSSKDLIFAKDDSLLQKTTNKEKIQKSNLKLKYDSFTNHLVPVLIRHGSKQSDTDSEVQDVRRSSYSSNDYNLQRLRSKFENKQTTETGVVPSHRFNKTDFQSKSTPSIIDTALGHDSGQLPLTSHCYPSVTKQRFLAPLSVTDNYLDAETRFLAPLQKSVLLPCHQYQEHSKHELQFREHPLLLHMEPLKPEECLNILEEHLTALGRTLQPDQWQLVANVFQKLSFPIFISVVKCQVFFVSIYSEAWDNAGIDKGHLRFAIGESINSTIWLLNWNSAERCTTQVQSEENEQAIALV
ncbi:unnamed protein product [Protopolystoma xenopodis]|uniref:NACHT domain-containing protein n=1 Tax=Protopolystoma xenopodis TaxID=117903 RepID=A0A448WMW3_9PLAT|nr:unnamed protein product [Protopolystoma xenopodis]